MENKKEKFKFENRTFETRVIFIKEIFSNKFDQTTIMASCVDYKLGASYKQFLNELHTSLWNLDGEDPIKILKRID